MEVKFSGEDWLRAQDLEKRLSLSATALRWRIERMTNLSCHKGRQGQARRFSFTDALAIGAGEYLIETWSMPPVMAIQMANILHPFFARMQADPTLDPYAFMSKEAAGGNLYGDCELAIHEERETALYELERSTIEGRPVICIRLRTLAERGITRLLEHDAAQALDGHSHHKAGHA